MANERKGLNDSSLGLLYNNGGGVSINESVDYNVLKPSDPAQRAAQLSSRSSLNELISKDTMENAEAYDSLSTLAISKDLNNQNTIAAERAGDYLNKAQESYDKAAGLNMGNRSAGLSIMSVLSGRSDFEKDGLMQKGNEMMALAKNQENIMNVNNIMANTKANEQNSINTAGQAFMNKSIQTESARNSLFPADNDLPKAAMAIEAAKQKAGLRGKEAVIDLSVEMQRTASMMRMNEGAQSNNPQAQRFLSAGQLAMSNGSPEMYEFAKKDYNDLSASFDDMTAGDKITRNVERARMDNNGLLPSQSKGLAVAQLFDNNPASSNMGNMVDPNERVAYDEYNKAFIANVIDETAKTNTGIVDKMREELLNKANPEEKKALKGRLSNMGKPEQNSYIASMYASRAISEGDANLVSLIGNATVNKMRNSNEIVARTNSKARPAIVNTFTNQYKDWFFRENVMKNPAFAEFSQKAKDTNELVAALPPEIQKEIVSDFRSQSKINTWFKQKAYDIGGYQNRPVSILSIANWDQIPFDIYKSLNGVK